MPTPTYDLVATTTLIGNTSDVVFASLPQTYRDLILVADVIAGPTQGVNVRFNGDTGTNYGVVMMRAEPTTTGSSSNTFNEIYATWSSVNAGADAQINMSLMDYSTTNKHKTMLIRNAYTGTTGMFAEAHAIRWANTAAVTSVRFYPTTGSFATASTFSIYGVIA